MKAVKTPPVRRGPSAANCAEPGSEGQRSPAACSLALPPALFFVMAETIFSKIIRGEIPSHKVYEDDHVLAFLDIGPLSRGHTLVIPKQAVKTVGELSDESAAAIGRVLPRLCRAVQKVTGCEDYNILQNNGAPAHQAVFHVHFHIIPKPNAEEGLGIVWKPGKLENGAELAREIQEALESESR